MDLQKVPLVTTLLRASRDADEELLRSVLRDILINGIPSQDLNAEDNSGRVSRCERCWTEMYVETCPIYILPLKKNT